MKKQILIAPSVLSADFSSLKDAVEMLEKGNADYVHCDVMDGTFVPAITFGAQAIAAMHRCTKLPLDVHLMIMRPENHIEAFAASGASFITFHPEATMHPHKVLQSIEKAGCKRGVVLNPGTSVSSVEYLLPLCDMVLLMSVNPGAGGQKFIHDTLRKARELAVRREELGITFDIEIDGGIDATTAPLAIEAGVNVLVAGSSVFGAQDPIGMIAKLRGTL